MSDVLTQLEFVKQWNLPPTLYRQQYLCIVLYHFYSEEMSVCVWSYEKKFFVFESDEGLKFGKLVLNNYIDFLNKITFTKLHWKEKIFFTLLIIY